MNRSKLQISVQILCSLSSKGPFSLEELSDVVELDRSNLGNRLALLYESGLVGEQFLGEGKKAYFITERGLSVLKIMGPMIKEAHRLQVRNFEVVSNSLSGALNPEKIKKKPKRKFSEFIKERRPKWKLSNLIKIEVVDSED